MRPVNHSSQDEKDHWVGWRNGWKQTLWKAGLGKRKPNWQAAVMVTVERRFFEDSQHAWGVMGVRDGQAQNKSSSTQNNDGRSRGKD